MHRSTRSRAERGLRNYRTRPAPLAERCRVISVGDEDYCPTCRLRWPMIEERPPCPRTEAVT